MIDWSNHWFYSEDGITKHGGIIEWAIRNWDISNTKTYPNRPLDINKEVYADILFMEHHNKTLEEIKYEMDNKWYLGHVSSGLNKKFVQEILCEFLSKYELKNLNEILKVKRIDADSIEQLIDKGTTRESVLNEEDTKKITALFESIEQPKIKLTVKTQALAPEDSFVAITEDEFMRRMKDMSAMQGMSMFGDMPTSYNLIINSNHPKATSLLSMDEGKQKASTQQLIDLALLSKQLLQGEQLTQFINRSIENL